MAEALINDWEYFEIIRTAANKECISRLETAIQQIDTIIAEGKHTKALKTLFGLQNVTHDVDFVSTISVCTIIEISTSSLTGLSRTCLAIGKIEIGIPPLIAMTSTPSVLL